jgi:predicted DNA binding CopG/RHH family protein
MQQNFTETHTKTKKGGKRLFSGAKPKYGEKTKTIAFRVPESKINDIKQLVVLKLKEYECRKT